MRYVRICEMKVHPPPVLMRHAREDEMKGVM